MIEIADSGVCETERSAVIRVEGTRLFLGEMMRLYVGNLGFTITDVQLESLFAQHGIVNSAKVMRRDTGKGRGFGFVEMSDGEAKRAMELLNGKDIGGRSLTVNEAREKPQPSTGTNAQPLPAKV